MAIDFPNSPTIGQTFQGYVWDGQAWQVAQGPAALGVVRYDSAQSLTPAQGVQARQNVFAAPFDAMAYNGMQINGSMDVSQQYGGTAQTTPGYIMDGWAWGQSGTGRIGAGQYAWGVNGFNNILCLTVPTAQASMSAGDLFYCVHNVEGNRVSRLAWGTSYALPLTLAFWSAHTRTGTYSLSIRNGTAARSYAVTYQQNVSTAAEYKTVTIPGDTAGTWAKDTTLGLSVAFTMAAGSTFIAPSANSWQAGNFTAAPGQINGIQATTDVFRIVGVMLLPGVEAPSSDRAPLIMRPFDQELTMCQRYLRRINAASGMMYSTTTCRLNIPHQGMRAAPTALQTGAGAFTDIYSANYTQSAAQVTATSVTPDGGQYDFANFTGMTAGRAVFMLPSTPPLQLDARL